MLGGYGGGALSFKRTSDSPARYLGIPIVEQGKRNGDRGILRSAQVHNVVT